jgi:DNA mismatch repair protein MutH
MHSTVSSVVLPPTSESQLLERARALEGQTLAALAGRFGIEAPPDLKRHKGWVGQLVERLLGADAASRDEPDFRGLGIELKTLPIDRRGVPCESTFVCTVPLHEVGETDWRASRVRRKLARVLWVVVQGDRDVPVPVRRVGAALLWAPSAEQERALEADWEEIAGLIGRGDIDGITARIGQFLQMRPKAAHSRVRRRTIDAEGELSMTMPRGFYLRATFTRAIVEQHFVTPQRR